MKRTAETKQTHAPLAEMRCAIYTRKSTEEGLEQEFNSLDAQRDAGEAYIASQKHEGWVCLPTRYDDGGFTGGNMERPALQRLLAVIATRWMQFTGKEATCIGIEGHRNVHTAPTRD